MPSLETKLNWIKRNSMTIIVLVAIAASFVFQSREAHQTKLEARADNIASCVRTNVRGALTAAWQRDVAGQVKSSPEISATLRAYALGSAANLEVAEFIENPANATRVKKATVDGRPAVVLRDRSNYLIREGCVEAFHANGELEGLLDNQPGVPEIPKEAKEAAQEDYPLEPQP